MHFLLAAVLLACVVDHIAPVSATLSPSSIADVSKLFHHNAYVSRKVRRKAGVRLNHESYHNRRVVPTVSAAPSVSSSATSPSSTQSMVGAASSSNATEAACMIALTALNGQATNPSGMAVCYNVVSYDNSTKAFQANLELYQISQGSGDWATLQKEGVRLGLSYPGATIAVTSNNTLAKRRNNILTRPPTQQVEKRGGIVSRTASPQIVSDMSFVGEVDESVVGGAYNQTALKAALVPVVTLSGNTQNGTQISTTLSSTDASFVYGIFADQNAAATPAMAQTIPFVLPGVHLGIFPTGLIITASWTVLFVVAVGLGTLGRRDHKQSYRRRVNNRIVLNAMNAPFNRQRF